MPLGVGFEVLKILIRPSLCLPDCKSWIIRKLPAAAPAPCLPACCVAPSKMGVDSPSETARPQMKCFLLQVASGMVSLHSNGKVSKIYPPKIPMFPVFEEAAALEIVNPLSHLVLGDKSILSFVSWSRL